MGNAVCKSKVQKHDTNVEVENRGLDLDEHEGNIHMLITGIDYACDSQSWAGPPPSGHGPLDTRFAFDMMVNLSKESGVVDQGGSVKTMWNEECTKEGICAGIAEVVSKCEEGDFFIFYYTGHGDRLPQDDANEAEEQDNCLCTVDAYGNTDDAAMQLRSQAWLRDDALAAAILDNVQDGVKVLVLADCCHSGSLCDFGPGSRWEQQDVQAISISGCQDTETSAGTGQGGMFSRALSKSIEELCQEEVSFATIYNHIQENYLENKNTGHTQNITISTSGVEADEWKWPLNPDNYMCPFEDEK
jgi:hypothetical protein